MADQDECYYWGRFKEDADRDEAKHNRWFVGAHMEFKPRRTELVEIKHCKYEHKTPPHEMKTSCTIECTLILRGKIRGTVAGRPITLSRGDYVVIAPGTPNALPESVIEEGEGLTIKAPSIPVAKHVMEEMKTDGWGFRIRRCAP